MRKNEIAGVLNEIGVLLDLQGENPFKVRAYQQGARAIEAIEESELERLIATGELGAIKGIGEALGKKIVELHTTGRLEFFERLRASVPAGLVEMMDIPGLGAKKVRALQAQLGITSVGELKAACEAGRVAELEGFGAKSQEKILAGIRNREAYGRRHLWWDAWNIAAPILAGLRQLAGVQRAEVAGSLRRGLETVGDLDFIVAATDAEPVMAWFTSLPEVGEVTARGSTKSSVRFRHGMQADLRLVPAAQFASALHHFTGSKEHNIAMRQRALARGWSLSEWGLTPVAPAGEAVAAASAPGVELGDEAAVFQALGLAYIAPELREGRGEIEAAAAGTLPRLIAAEDVRGAFHCHTTASDGRNTLREMAAAAAARGWEYLGISDHSVSSFQAHGLEPERLAAQIREIRALNATGQLPVFLFAGVECDILADGSLDYTAELRRELDFLVVSVHSAFSQDEETMTRRIVRALEQPGVTMLGHPTGRLLLRRDGYRVDLERVIDAAIAHGVIIELNATPSRWDLDWRYWRRAAERGLRCAINPDAHETNALDYVYGGVRAARKGWLTPEMVLNTRPRAEVSAHFAARRNA